MAATAPPSAAAVPTAPDRTDRATFSARATAFFDYIKNTMWGDMTAFTGNAYTNALAAATSAGAAATSETNAANSESAAAASAVAAANSAGAPMWVSGTTYSLGAAVWSPANRIVYRRIVAGAGTTDPSADATNWALVGTLGLAVTVVSGTTQTAVAGSHYILTNGSPTTVTLPTSPSSGDTVWVTWANTLATNVIARGGQTIMGIATDMTLDASTNGTVQLRFVNSDWRIL